MLLPAEFTIDREENLWLEQNNVNSTRIQILVVTVYTQLYP